jgi:CHAP domain
MSVESVLARVAAIEQTIANPAALIAANATTTGGTAAATATQAGTAAEPTVPAGTTFAQALRSANTGTPTAAGLSVAAPTSLYQASATGTTGTTGERIVRIAETQVGQTEQPPGSNESPAIAQYRTAAAGAIPGAPWCAYFASWAAKEAGTPIGVNGEGAGSVSQIWSWAQSTGRAVENGPGVVPKPGDLIVFGGEHVGVVKGVLPNGNIETIEGNYENKVALNVRTPTEATGYVNMN